MKIVMLGPPGAGKGTQADALSEKMEILHISTGDMFRRAVKDQTAMGLEAKKYMDSGALVPDEVTIGIVRERLAMRDCAKGFILDGFPRTAYQAEALDGILGELEGAMDAVIYISVDTETLIGRLSGRRICKNCSALYHVSYNPPKKEGVCDKCGGELYQRDDDQEETVRRRLEVYNSQTLPLVGYYRDKGLLTEIHGNQRREKVTEDILAALGRSG
ncbi:MAG: adenylate kinase [Clostridiales bacterium]|nr:adenylate kinase [Clostridiales bacterium]